MPEFRERYVLGEGYPWAMGIGPYREVVLSKTSLGLDPQDLNWPDELWRKDLPQYRLVLERVD